jgi:hypothetical protein
MAATLDLFAPVFKLYSQYTAHVGKAMVALTKIKTKHERAKDFKKAVSTGEASAACEGTNLRSLLNAPVRRPAQYPTLVRSIQRATNKNQPDFTDLEKPCLEFEKK